MATSLAELIKDPNYTNANPATKQAIFEKYAPQDPNYTNANPATQQAIRTRFGLVDAVETPAAPSEIPGQRAGVNADYVRRLAEGATAGPDPIREMIKNTPSSAMKFAGGLAEAITHPVQTLGTMMDIGAGALQNALPKPVVDFVNSLSSDPAAAKRAVDAANAMGGELANRYGSFNKLYNTVTTDPVNAAADLSMVLGVGAGLTAGAAGAAAKVGVPNTARVVSGAKAVGDVGRTIDPLMASARPFVKGFKFVTIPSAPSDRHQCVA